MLNITKQEKNNWLHGQAKKIFLVVSSSLHLSRREVTPLRPYSSLHPSFPISSISGHFLCDYLQLALSCLHNNFKI
jgi:hypothetical protein